MDTKSSLGRWFPIDFLFLSLRSHPLGKGVGVCVKETSVVIVYVIGLSSFFNIEVRIAESFVIFGLLLLSLSPGWMHRWGVVCLC